MTCDDRPDATRPACPSCSACWRGWSCSPSSPRGPPGRDGVPLAVDLLLGLAGRRGPAAPAQPAAAGRRCCSGCSPRSARPRRPPRRPARYVVARRERLRHRGPGGAARASSGTRCRRCGGRSGCRSAGGCCATSRCTRRCSAGARTAGPGTRWSTQWRERARRAERDQARKVEEARDGRADADRARDARHARAPADAAGDDRGRAGVPDGPRRRSRWRRRPAWCGPARARRWRSCATVIGVLREAPDELRPTPGLADLPALVDAGARGRVRRVRLDAADARPADRRSGSPSTGRARRG